MKWGKNKRTNKISVKLFEEGAKLAKFCNEQLKKAENKILSLDEVEEEV